MKAALRRQLRKVPAIRRMHVIARFGDTRRVAPLDSWGDRRGRPVDRWYIERFLDAHAAVVTGHVLEVKEDAYATRLGASEVDVLDIDPTNPRAPLTGDLCAPDTLPVARFDAAI